MPVEDYAAAMAPPGNRRVRIGVPRDFFFADLDPQVSQALEQALNTLVKLGAESREVSIEVSTTGRTVIQAEVYAYHSASIAKHPERYLPETLGKLRLGAGIDLATYIQARLKLDQLRRRAPKTFAEVDIIVTPTTPVAPPMASELPSSFDEIMSNDALMWCARRFRAPTSR